MYWLCPRNTGVASWFCCGNPYPGRCAATGSGACGTCSSGNNQCAWPNISDNCLNQMQPQVCGLTFPRLGCGTAINVINRCTGLSVNAAIADCGPKVKDFCNSAICCLSFVCAVTRIIDLTPAAFTAIGGNLDTGLIPAQINQTIILAC